MSWVHKHFLGTALFVLVIVIGMFASHHDILSATAFEKLVTTAALCFVIVTAQLRRRSAAGQAR